jgi:hypothetical protein
VSEKLLCQKLVTDVAREVVWMPRLLDRRERQALDRLTTLSTLLQQQDLIVLQIRHSCTARRRRRKRRRRK